MTISDSEKGSGGVWDGVWVILSRFASDGVRTFSSWAYDGTVLPPSQGQAGLDRHQPVTYRRGFWTLKLIQRLLHNSNVHPTLMLRSYHQPCGCRGAQIHARWPTRSILQMQDDLHPEPPCNVYPPVAEQPP